MFVSDSMLEPDVGCWYSIEEYLALFPFTYDRWEWKDAETIRLIGVTFTEGFGIFQQGTRLLWCHIDLARDELWCPGGRTRFQVRNRFRPSRVR